MASACVNNITMSPEKFPPASYPSYGWLSPRISFSREDEDSSKQPAGSSSKSKTKTSADLSGHPQAEDLSDPVDFEFRLEVPVTMLPADELFSDGKLMPLQVTSIKPVGNNTNNGNNDNGLSEIIRSTETTSVKSCRSRIMEMEIISTGTDPYLFSPKAPRCSSRWKELLGLKKLYQNANAKLETNKTTLFSSSANPNPKSLKHFLHRSSKSCTCSSSSALDQPLLKDTDCESVSISSARLSLSSSSSGHEHEDLPRLSLDSEKPSPNPFILNRNPNPRMRAVKPRAEINNANGSNGSSNKVTSANRVGRSPIRRGTAGDQSSGATSRGVSVDSPRMNSSGKIVFQSLERSSSSPSSFNGGPRLSKHRGMERSYSANVRVTPVLNVPVCSLRGTSKSFGFGQLFSSSPQKRECSTNKGHSLQQHQQQLSNASRSRT